MKTVLGFVVSPLAGTIAFLLLVLAAYSDAHSATPILSALRMGAQIVFPGVVVAGVPAHFVLRRSRFSTWYGYAAAGLLLGCLAVVFRISLSAWDYGTSSGIHNVLAAITFDFLPYAPLGAIAGVTTGLVFWVVARPPIARLTARVGFRVDLAAGAGASAGSQRSGCPVNPLHRPIPPRVPAGGFNRGPTMSVQIQPGFPTAALAASRCGALAGSGSPQEGPCLLSDRMRRSVLAGLSFFDIVHTEGVASSRRRAD